MLEASVLPPELSTASVSQVLPYVLEQRRCIVTSASAFYLHWNQLKWKITSRKKARSPFVLLETLEMLTQQDRAPIQPSLALDGERYQQHLEITVGAWPKSWLYTTLSHCTRPLWFSFCYIFPSPRGRLVKKPFVWHSVFKSKLW